MKKTIAFITVHIGVNVGSNLQAIATSEVLKKTGHDPILINYIPPRVSYKRYWSDAKKSWIRFLKAIYNFPRVYSLNKKFEKYQSKHCIMTKPIYDYDNFRKVVPKADIYMTGSDQVWNFVHNEGYDYHYFFDGIKGKKVAFAASIGMNTLATEEAKILKEKLLDYDKITVREDRAVELLQEIGIKSEQIIDPTLLLNKDQWKQYMSEPVFNEPYVLVYHPYNIVDIQKIYDVARKVANKKNLKVVSFLWWERHPIKQADKTIFNASPGEFLSLMYHADYVITNSFHGTAFSINFNKQFWVFSPSKFSSRITSLVNMLGIENRLINAQIEDKDIDSIIEYKGINAQLDSERARAMQFLKSL